MKKTILLFVLVSFCFGYSFAKSIDAATALTVAKNFCKVQSTIAGRLASATPDVSLVYTCNKSNANAQGRAGEEALYYVFNLNTKDGFVIIAGDDAVIPVLGYGDEGAYDNSTMPSTVKAWMNNYAKQILRAKANSLVASEEIKTSWDELLNSNVQMRSESTTAVNPLLTTKWNQYPYYNALCPGNSVTGCVATTMAQIMKFWNYPAYGNGTTGAYTTTTNHYNVPSVALNNYTFNYASMPNSVTSSNSAVARLMYNCGVSVKMDYTPQESGAYVLALDWEGSHPNSAQSAFTNYFHYANTIKGVQSYKYSTSGWISLMEGELNAGRPVMYCAWDTSGSGGHTWVCDGYDSYNNLHMNWGWGGVYDGYYAYGALDPSPYYYDLDNEALIGIKPNTSVGIEEENNANLFSLYPNPTSGDFTLKASAQFRDAQVSIFNPIGEIIFTDAFNTNADFEEHLHLHLAHGIYFIKVNTSTEQYTRKLIVE